MKFNLNNYVQVKLTEKGKQVLNQKIDNDLEILNRYGIDTSTYDRSEPQDGYWKFQLWEVMQIFGPYMKQGLENVIEMDIILEVEKPKTITVMGTDGDKWVAKEIPVEDFEKLQKSVTEESSLRAESSKLLKEEVQKARKKFPGAEDLTVALMEEAGELAQATLKCDSENIKKEALQVACVAMRIFEEGDSTFTKRVGISQDEKYEYEKCFIGQDVILLDCGYNNDFYWFKIDVKYSGISILKTKIKPAKRTLFDVAQGNCKKGWIVEDRKGNIRFDGITNEC